MEDSKEDSNSDEQNEENEYDENNQQDKNEQLNLNEEIIKLKYIFQKVNGLISSQTKYTWAQKRSL